MTVRRFRHRPVEVAALQWIGNNHDQMREFAGSDFDSDGDDGNWLLDTDGNWCFLKPGQWVVKVGEGAFERYDDLNLQATYEEVTE